MSDASTISILSSTCTVKQMRDLVELLSGKDTCEKNQNSVYDASNSRHEKHW